MNAAAATATGGQCHSNPCKDLSHSMSLAVLDSGCVDGWQVAAQAVATFVYFLLQSTLLSVVKGRANQLTLLSLTQATPSLSLLLSPPFSHSPSLCPFADRHKFSSAIFFTFRSFQLLPFSIFSVFRVIWHFILINCPRISPPLSPLHPPAFSHLRH